MATRTARLGWLAAALALALGLGEAADAAVVCQKGKKIKLRADACRANETPATLGDAGGDDPAGIWKFTAGTMFGYSELQGELLVLNPDGSGRLNLSGGDGPVAACIPFNYSRGQGRTLVLDDWGYFFDTRVLRFELQAGSTLQLVDAVGLTASFDHVSAAEDDEDCESLVKDALFTGLPKPYGSSGLAFDGTDLWYLQYDGDSIVPVDPSTGAPGASIDFAERLHAAQGGDFWASSGDTAVRWSRAGQQLDEVRPFLDFGEAGGAQAIAFDAAKRVLWLHGSDNADQGRLLKVDSDAEPDVLLAAFDLDGRISAMAVGANALWAVDSYYQSVMRIDPATGKVTGTFLIPDRSAYWQGIAVVGNQIFLVGGTDVQGSVLVLETPVN